MLTFLFTDIAESSRLWQQYPQTMSRSLAAHDDVMQRVIPAHNGQVVKSTGDGVHAIFPRVGDACRATVALQQALAACNWEETGPLQVRMGMHSGEAEARDGDYFGTAVNKAARVMSLAAGGQVLLSDLSNALLREAEGDAFGLRSLGSFRLKGLSGRTEIFQLLHPALQAEFPPIRGGESVPNNLPGEMTSFVGREVEQAQVIQYLLDTDADPDRRRLVTLIGPGGTGKTRLSIRAGRDLREGFSDGVWLVELAPITDPAAVPAQVLAALDLQATAQAPEMQLVRAYLRDRQALLIFDNCEHLVEPSAQVIDEILKHAPLVQVLASSREALGVYGETVLRLPPLPVPPDGPGSWDDIRESAAVQLFLARAESAGGGRWLTAEAGPAIAQICRRLDGIPLAIEMAAARLRVFSPAQVLERLDDRFRLLTGGSRTALPRQQTLQALIDWSYELLSEDEQGLLQELSVFAGGWTIEMAEAVCEGRDVYLLLPQLVDKSLVVAEPHDGEMRYLFLETIRQYARDRLLASGRSAEIRHRHLRYLAALVRFDGEWSPKKIIDWLRRAGPDLENFRSALTWGLEEDPLTALELSAGLLQLWTVGPVPEGLQWVSRALEKVTESRGPDLVSSDDRRLKQALAEGYLARAGLLIPVGLNEQAWEAASLSVQLFEDLDLEGPWMVACGIMALAGFTAGQADEALRKLDQALELATRKQNTFYRSGLLSIKGLGHIYIDQDIPSALRCLEEAIALEPYYGASSIPSNFALIKIQMMRGNWDRAREVVEIAQRNIPTGPSYIDTRGQQAMYQAERGHIERLSGNLDAALNIYSRMILLYRELSGEAAVANLLESFAMVARQRGRTERAGRLFGAAEALRERIEADMTAYERAEYQAAVGALRSAMAPEAFEAAWLEGRRLDMDQAIAFARAYAELPGE